MRATTWTRWATCALAISIAMPAATSAFAEKHKSLADCTVFDQADKGEDAVEFTIRNSCAIPVDCSISWQLVCAPESHKRRSTHPGSSRLTLTEGGASSASTSAAVCGDDGWKLDAIEWSCTPNKG
jgi:hypothetical protein